MDEEFLDADIGLEYDDENNEEENDDGDIIEDNIDLDLGLENTGDGQGVELGDFNGMNTLSSFTDAGAASAKKRERSNAKAVECLDLDGNLIEVFRSGLAAATKLNIPQGDISLCCRGLKHQVNGYRFRFFGDQQDPSEFKLKRGYRYVLEGTSEQKQETSMRTTRASRGEYAVGHRHTGGDDGDFSIRKRFMEVAHIKVRIEKILFRYVIIHFILSSFYRPLCIHCL